MPKKTNNTTVTLIPSDYDGIKSTETDFEEYKLMVLALLNDNTNLVYDSEGEESTITFPINVIVFDFDMYYDGEETAVKVHFDEEEEKYIADDETVITAEVVDNQIVITLAQNVVGIEIGKWTYTGE